jgi:hypothetical protein
MWTSLILFIAILFLYVHLQHQYKYHKDIQIYETEFKSKKGYQETCSLRQPTITTINDIIPLNANFISKYKDLQYNIKDTRDYLKEHTNSIETVSLNYSQTSVLFDTDKNGHFYTDNNFDNEVLRQVATSWDNILKPTNTVYSKYDVLFGSKNTVTPYFYHTSTSKFLFITGKEIRVQMYSFAHSSTLRPTKDYENYEFWSTVQPNDKSVEFFVYQGQVLFIPPYCFYSIQFKHHETIICTAEYSTGLNLLANAKHIMLYIMQNQNIYTNILTPLRQSGEDLRDAVNTLNPVNTDDEEHDETPILESTVSIETPINTDISGTVSNSLNEISEKVVGKLKTID